MEELKKLKVAELKEKLTELGLSTTGKKDELVQRLHDHQQQSAGTGTKPASASAVKSPTTQTQTVPPKSPVQQPKAEPVYASCNQYDADSLGLPCPRRTTNRARHRHWRPPRQACRKRNGAVCAHSDSASPLPTRINSFSALSDSVRPSVCVFDA
jgi:hypothetical protein